GRDRARGAGYGGPVCVAWGSGPGRRVEGERARILDVVGARIGRDPDDLDTRRLRLQPDAEPLADRLPFREQPSGQTLAQDRDAPPTRPIGPGEVASGHDPYADGVEEAGRDRRLLPEHAALEHRGFASSGDQLPERAARAWLQQRGADAAD